jgi:hypothetical protein
MTWRSTIDIEWTSETLETRPTWGYTLHWTEHQSTRQFIHSTQSAALCSHVSELHMDAVFFQKYLRLSQSKRAAVWKAIRATPVHQLCFTPSSYLGSAVATDHKWSVFHKCRKCQDALMDICRALARWVKEKDSSSSHHHHDGGGGHSLRVCVPVQFLEGMVPILQEAFAESSIQFIFSPKHTVSDDYKTILTASWETAAVASTADSNAYYTPLMHQAIAWCLKTTFVGGHCHGSLLLCPRHGSSVPCDGAGVVQHQWRHLARALPVSQ